MALQVLLDELGECWRAQGIAATTDHVAQIGLLSGPAGLWRLARAGDVTGFADRYALLHLAARDFRVAAIPA